MLIDRWLPDPDVFEHHQALVRADPETVYRQVRLVDFGRSPAVRALFLARALPGLLLAGFRGGGRPSAWSRLRIDDVLQRGFVVLAEEPGVELVLGAVGRFWRPRGELLRIDAAGFAGFDRPGYAKGAMNIRVEPRPDGSTRVVTETRVRCTDARSRHRFLQYWRVIGPFSGLIRRRVLASLAAASERAVAGSAEPAPGTMPQ